MKNNTNLHMAGKITLFSIGGYFLYLTWQSTVVAFLGGTIPILGWTLEGGFIPGLLWIFIGDPIIMTIGYWVAMIVSVPVAMIADSLSKNNEPSAENASPEMHNHDADGRQELSKNRNLSIKDKRKLRKRKNIN